ncbi:hypothetical protein C8R43DRAFT_887958 [Mycena crocata]|nr:hypothetical protein C8R43DRAFT_887958 [Mycena crocata]
MLHIVQFFWDSYVAWLEKHCLRFMYRLPEYTTVVALIAKIVGDMETSGTKWRFARSSPSLIRHLRPHESLALQLLGLVNKGIPRSDGVIFMRRQPADRSLTLAGLLADPKLFSKSKLCNREGRLILKFVVAHSGITGLFDSGDGATRRHSCLPTLFHSLFSIENENSENTSEWSAPECDSGGESDNESEMEELERTLLVCAISSHDSSNFVLPISTTSLADCSLFLLSPLMHQQLVVYPAIRDGELWEERWVPQPGSYGGLFNMSDFAKSIFDTASSGGHPSELLIEGFNIEALTTSFIDKIKAAVADRDFTHILSPDRTFQILRPDGSILSFGAGIEREVLYSAFCIFTDSEGAWFLPRFDGMCSIATTMSLASSAFVGPDRIVMFSVLGCIIALLLIYGIAPEPLSPAVIQFAASGFDLASLDEQFLREWHPDLVALLHDWKAMGPEGDVGAFQSFFASYHDMQAIALRHRSIAQHRALGHEMVYCAVIRSQPPSHTEPEAFYKGLRLGCSNGFDFFQVIRSYPGGSTTFLSHIWTSVIQDYESLRPHMSICTVSPEGLIPIGGPGSTIPDFRSILEGFLAGYGVPCPNLFAEAKGSLSALIPIDNMDSPAFRSRCLCWAVTGSPHVEFEDHQQIDICFVGPNDVGYNSVASRRAEMMSLGKIAFRTCFRTARIPASHILGLVRQTYPAKDKEGNDTEPFTASQAIQHWLLMEILGAIGFHSMT